MQFKTLVAFAIAAVAPATSALRYTGYSSTVQCSGPSFSCNDGGAVCCSLPTGFGYSVQFFGLGAGQQGQGYTGGGCKQFKFSVFGPGNKCWNGGGSRVSNMNWFHSPHGRSLVPRAAANTTCADADEFNYEGDDGVERSIKIPAGGAQKVAELYSKKDYEALAAYEAY